MAAYKDCLTGVWHGDFSYTTRKQAGIVYAAYKRGDLRLTRAQVRDLYDSVGEYSHYLTECIGHIIAGRLDMAQAIADGYSVEEVTNEIVENVTLTQEMFDAYKEGHWDEGINVFTFVCCKVGDVVERHIGWTEPVWVVGKRVRDVK